MVVSLVWAAVAVAAAAAVAVGRVKSRLTIPTATTCSSKVMVVVSDGRRRLVAFMAKSEVSPSFLKTDKTCSQSTIRTKNIEAVFDS